ncbi:MAG: molecular chaperone TorD family protein, partial [Cyanobacteria bacterium NC_groundwater_1444_Ag_S-0.65um_54_12]|nr:molecular chaperone TorD family protein [Cyanobacteria bacterium NC_groundwater_1444_Ag_S-0.65um_54_12]
MTDDPESIKKNLARSGLYRLLSLGFGYPAAALRQEYQRSLDCIRNASVQASWEPVWSKLESDSAEDLEGEYLRLFATNVVCSPYESEQGAGPKDFTKARDLSDIQGFYQAFGFSLVASAGELGDHIRVELEFMSILCLKEAYFFLWGEGMDEAVAIVRDGQRLFLRDHLG